MFKMLMYLKGYLLVYIYRGDNERFLNLCTKRGINLWDICVFENGYCAKILLKDYWHIRPLIRKTRTRVIVKKRFGLPFFIAGHKSKIGYLMGIFIAFICMYIMSLYVWDIDIRGTNNYAHENILSFLEEQEVKVGIKKERVDCSELEKQLMFTFSEVAWVSIEKSGTRLIVEIIETSEHPKLVKEIEPCDIVSRKEGIITKVVMRKGVPLVKKGDVVKTGDMLVSGSIVIKEEEVIKSINYVHSDGDIYAKTVYDYKDSIDYNYTEKIYYEDTIKAYGINFGNYRFYFFHPKIKYTNYDVIYNNKRVKIWGDFYLPIATDKTEYKPYEIEEKSYTIEEAKGILEADIEQFIKALLEQGAEIIENKIEFVEEEKGIIAIGEITVNEKIGMDQIIITE